MYRLNVGTYDDPADPAPILPFGNFVFNKSHPKAPKISGAAAEFFEADPTRRLRLEGIQN